MATFPALKPSTRTFTPGERPHSQIRTMDGGQSRVRQSNVLVNQRLRLSFAVLTEAEMLSIRTHYIGQQGKFLSFDIPNDLLSGVTTPADFTPTGYSWVYASTPVIEDTGCSRYNVSLELVTIPPEGASVNGSYFTIGISLAPGKAGGGASGADLTVTASIDPGAATGA
jgi:hypothetical protein